MERNFKEGVEDVQMALAAGRPVRDHGPFGVLIGDENIEYSPVVIDDPVPTGNQLLQAAGVRNPIEYLVFQVLETGTLEGLRPDETVDLRKAGVEKFLIFKNDRSFRLQLDSQAFDWGAPHISGATLKKLAGVDAKNHEVWLDTQGVADREISDKELVDLTKPGVEKFYTQVKPITVIVNARPYSIRSVSLTFLEVVKLPYPDAVISDTRVYTVTYKRGPHANPEGTLVNGGSVFVKEGMAFNVLFSDKS